MQHDDGVYIQHMLDTARRAVFKVEGFDRSAYDANENLRLEFGAGDPRSRAQGLTRDAGTFSDDPLDSGHRMRHVIVHDYLGVDEGTVWQVISHDLLPLIAVLEEIEHSQS